MGIPKVHTWHSFSHHRQGAQIGPFPGRAQLQATGPIQRSSADLNIGVPSSGPGTSVAASGPMMSARWPSNVIVVNGERAPFAARYESLAIGPEYRFVATPDSVRACPYVTLSRGKERDREGT